MTWLLYTVLLGLCPESSGKFQTYEKVQPEEPMDVYAFYIALIYDNLIKMRKKSRHLS